MNSLTKRTKQKQKKKEIVKEKWEWRKNLFKPKSFFIESLEKTRFKITKQKATSYHIWERALWPCPMSPWEHVSWLYLLLTHKCSLLPGRVAQGLCSARPRAFKSRVSQAPLSCHLGLWGSLGDFQKMNVQKGEEMERAAENLGWWGSQVYHLRTRPCCHRTGAWGGRAENKLKSFNFFG